MALRVLYLTTLVSSLAALPISKPMMIAHVLWTGVFVLGGILFFLAPNLLFIQSLFLIMQLSSIALAITVIIWRIPKIKNSWWYEGLRVFTALSMIFLVLLGLDMSISLIPIPALDPVDNFSLPLYLISLSV